MNQGNDIVFSSAKLTGILTAIGLVAFSAWLPVGLGQTTSAVCNSTDFLWSFNTYNHTPCVLAAILSVPCIADPSYDNVDALGESDAYYLPSSNATLCECSTVVYSFYSVCAACQGAAIIPWSFYTSTCKQTSPDGQYVFAIPKYTAVPAWAYQKVQAANIFNITLARGVGDSPENYTGAPSTSQSQTTTMSQTLSMHPSSATHSALVTTTSSSQTAAGTGSDTVHHKSTPIGVIIGASVGGACAVIVVAVILGTRSLRRKKRQRYEESITRSEKEVGSMSPDPHQSPMLPPTSVTPPLSTHQQSAVSYTSVNPVLGPKPYDPDDPSTFPPKLDQNAYSPNTSPGLIPVSPAGSPRPMV